MKRRLRVADGRLLDRDGTVVAVLDSITFEVKEPLPHTPFKERTETAPPNSPPNGEFAAEIAEAWRRWVQLRRPARTNLASGTEKQLRRALKAGYTVDQLETAMHALVASPWHREHDQLTLSTIFATKPGGKTFEDQVDTWLLRGTQLSSSPGAVDVEGFASDRVASAKATVRQTWGRDSNAARELLGAALAELTRHDIAVYDDNGRPRFGLAS